MLITIFEHWIGGVFYADHPKPYENNRIRIIYAGNLFGHSNNLGYLFNWLTTDRSEPARILNVRKAHEIKPFLTHIYIEMK